MQSSICHNNKREKLTPEFSDINTGCWLPKIKESKNFAAVLFPLDITLYLHCLHIFTQEILNWKPIVNHKDWVPSIKLIFMGMRQFFFFVNKKMKISGFKKGHFFQSLDSLTLMCQPTLLYRETVGTCKPNKQLVQLKESQKDFKRGWRNSKNTE